MSKPHIDATEFGSITIDGAVFEHDVVIATDGAVSKRKKKLSKAIYAIYGSSHTISLPEAEYLLAQGAHADRLLIGSGCSRARPPGGQSHGSSVSTGWRVHASLP